MGRSRYTIYEPTHPHFVTCTILNWLPIFTRQESIKIIFDSLNYLNKNDNLKIYAYVILENHLHMIVQSNDLSRTMKHFKRHTARQILNLLKEQNIHTILDQFKFYKRAHKSKTTYQVWQEGFQPILMQNDKMMIDTIKYIHHNPVKRGYVAKDIHWLYSSARDYNGVGGKVEIERFW